MGTILKLMAKAQKLTFVDYYSVLTITLLFDEPQYAVKIRYKFTPKFYWRTHVR